MNYLLDTNVLINYLRGNEVPEEFVLEEGVSVSIITQAELFYGAYKSDHPRKNLGRVREVFADWELVILPLGEETIDIFAEAKAGLEYKGRRLEDFDLLIAATALTHNLTLVTRNTKHFKRIPRLKLQEP